MGPHFTCNKWTHKCQNSSKWRLCSRSSEGAKYPVMSELQLCKNYRHVKTLDTISITVQLTAMIRWSLRCRTRQASICNLYKRTSHRFQYILANKFYTSATIKSSITTVYYHFKITIKNIFTAHTQQNAIKHCPFNPLSSYQAVVLLWSALVICNWHVFWTSDISALSRNKI